uniref:Uncharacterized protein n=1 Tax=Anolis carolinensis TaxID=28377 RepID=A0A803TPP7_ANOCA
MANCAIHTCLNQTKVLSPTLDISQIYKLLLPSFQQTSQPLMPAIDVGETSGENYYSNALNQQWPQWQPASKNNLSDGAAGLVGCFGNLQSMSLKQNTIKILAGIYPVCIIS